MPQTSSIENQLMTTFLEQKFEIGESNDIEMYKQFVSNYVKIEQCVAVLSDYQSDRSYIYAGSFGSVFGLPNEKAVIDSAFEECIFTKINSEDLIDRHILELNFYQFLKGIPKEEYSNYSTFSRLRMKESVEKCAYINHRTIYLKTFSNGSISLALCLYIPSTDLQPRKGIDGKIFNIQTGEIIESEKYKNKAEAILSKREVEVLANVAKGYKSEQIAAEMHISVYTVRRHRQNIIEKLKVTNTAEAIQTAIVMGII
ncbi:response regulator transcription factor [Flavobacterium sp. HBTb2-11-1]|uniref:response regulator transcription factor n=1 Tax=Flavobacterium sp. HBTb2-11-1 TaxID=2692212 RepID=UPI0013713F98|nr:helix-turn-helix transcriptional regulator [Flavobacterium sp. HBTb2-11-1]MXO04670.1 helix-turn-helix transcriptional regulator [Flavobacterium sp. HBTb2-11-1]